MKIKAITEADIAVSEILHNVEGQLLRMVKIVRKHADEMGTDELNDVLATAVKATKHGSWSRQLAAKIMVATIKDHFKRKGKEMPDVDVADESDEPPDEDADAEAIDENAEEEVDKAEEEDTVDEEEEDIEDIADDDEDASDEDIEEDASDEGDIGDLLNDAIKSLTEKNDDEVDDDEVDGDEVDDEDEEEDLAVSKEDADSLTSLDLDNFSVVASTVYNINAALQYAGFDGNTVFHNDKDAIDGISRVLAHYGFTVSVDGDPFPGEFGSYGTNIANRTIEVSWTRTVCKPWKFNTDSTDFNVNGVLIKAHVGKGQ